MNNKQNKLLDCIIRALSIIEDDITTNKSTIINDNTAYILNNNINAIKKDVKKFKRLIDILSAGSDDVDYNLFFEHIYRAIDIIEQLIIRNHFGNVYIADTTTLNSIKEEMNIITDKVKVFIENAYK